jgi:hypothetical protein
MRPQYGAALAHIIMVEGGHWAHYLSWARHVSYLQLTNHVISRVYCKTVGPFDTESDLSIPDVLIRNKHYALILILILFYFFSEHFWRGYKERNVQTF